MAFRRLSRFPPPTRTTPEGVLAVGGRPDAATLAEAYRQGIFPWPHEGMPLLWFCPDPRFVLDPARAHLSRSLRKTIRRGRYEVRADTAFAQVIARCAAKPRPEQDGTWISDEMIAGYTELHDQGLAHSLEAWRDGELVGGLYGVSFGGVFFGESMFADAPDASKVAFATLLAQLVRWDFALVDCQSYTDHLATFGAEEWPRRTFLRVIERAMRRPTRRGKWQLELGPMEAEEVLKPVVG
jgi:leucyl/phenylalanyl-tRNA--protein transferase